MVKGCKRAAQDAFCGIAITLLITASAHAQDRDNVLGLPAVPQRLEAPTPAASATSAAKKSAAMSKPAAEENKAALSGQISLASFYQPDLITVRVVTSKTFVGAAPRAEALQAAKLVQRDVRLVCGKLCQPAPMPAPRIRADNKLSFDLIVKGYAGSISTADMINMVSGKPIGAATQAAPTLTGPAVPASAPAKP
jgi:hypothetical protein